MMVNLLTYKKTRKYILHLLLNDIILSCLLYQPVEYSFFTKWNVSELISWDVAVTISISSKVRERRFSKLKTLNCNSRVCHDFD